jgi:hypothetical protein
MPDVVADIDYAWKELGVFDRVDAARALESIIERGLTGVIALIGDVEHGRRQSGLDLLNAVKSTLTDLHKEMCDVPDTFVRPVKTDNGREETQASAA